ncbi:putative membrane GTPase involved in stress response [Streptacidiphilus sp. MAP12-16]
MVAVSVVVVDGLAALRAGLRGVCVQSWLVAVGAMAVDEPAVVRSVCVRSSALWE